MTTQPHRTNENIWALYKGAIEGEWMETVLKKKVTDINLGDMLFLSYFPEGTTFNDLIDIMKLDREKIDKRLRQYGWTLEEGIEYERLYYTKGNNFFNFPKDSLQGIEIDTSDCVQD